MTNKNTRRGNTQQERVVKNKVILNLIQDLQRLSLALPLINNLRGRAHIKYGMTPLFDNGDGVEDAEQKLLSIHLFDGKGFTLIELLVVVLIIGILAVVALPQYQKAVYKARATQLVSMIDAYKKAIDVYVLEHGYENVTFTRNDALDLVFPEEQKEKIMTHYCGPFDCGTARCSSDTEDLGCVIMLVGEKIDLFVDKNPETGGWIVGCTGNDTEGEIACNYLNQ